MYVDRFQASSSQVQVLKLTSYRPTSSLRRIAFEKLGLLSVQSSRLPEDNVRDVKRLTDACPNLPNARQGRNAPTIELPLDGDEDASKEAMNRQFERIQAPMVWRFRNHELACSN